MSELLQIEFIDDNFTVDKSEEYQLLVRKEEERFQMAICSRENHLLLLLSWHKSAEEERIHQLLSLRYHSKTITIETKNRTLIPNELYATSQDIYYLNFFSLDRGSYSILADQVKGYDTKCVYSISIAEQRQLLSDFPDFVIKSDSTIVLSALAALSSKSKDILSVNVENGYTHFSYISNGKLLYHHAQPSQHVDEFNYFLLAITQEYNIDLAGISIVISGQVEVDDPVYKRLKKYNDQISFFDLSGIIECNNFNLLKKSYQKLSLFGLLCA